MADYDSVLRDTTVEAAAAYYEALRRMTPEERFRRALRLSDELREVLVAGIRQRHPDYDEQTVKLARNRLLWGDALFAEVYPGVTVQT